jgi:TolA-binding protein
MTNRRRWYGAFVLALVLAVPAARAQDAQSEEFARRQYESGLAFLREQKFGEALKDFQTVVETYPATRVADAALLQIAIYHLETGWDPAASQAALDSLLKKYPTSDSAPMAHVLAGRLLVARSRAQADIDSALSNFERVPRLYPGSEAVPAALFQAGETLRLTRREAEAIGRYRQVSVDFPQSIWAARAMIGEARCQVITGKVAPAMELLQRVRQRFPSTPEASTALAWNTILYRLYLRPPAQPPYQFAARTLVGSSGKLKDIEALAVDRRGMVIAAGGSVILPFDSAGKVQGPMSAAEPVGIAFERNGDALYVLKAGLLKGRQPFGLSVPKPDGSPRVLDDVTSGVVTSMGELLLADKQTKAIGRFSTVGKYLGPFAPLPSLRLAIDATDRVAAVEQDGGGIAIIDSDGRVRAKIPPKGQGYEFDKVVDLAFDPFGHVYALDRGQGTVFVFATQQPPRLVASFSIAAKAAGAFRRGRALGLDSAGRLYIYDDDVEKIQVYQ